MCVYTSHAVFCASGCANGACLNDPCAGMSCASPPASFCADAQNLTVYESPGSCAAGVCSYPTHSEFCSFGCTGGICSGNPCVGVSCTTPPAGYCADASTARKYQSQGTCAAGACTYPFADVPCSFGCAEGKCLECIADGDCMAGKWCDGGACAECNTDSRCGSTCKNCLSSSEVCDAASGSCVTCLVDANCGSGSFCSGGACFPCDTDARCGASCVACSGGTPTCTAGACICTGSSCGANQQCIADACQVCKTDAACGDTCSPCGGTTLHCLDSGTTSSCVECTADDQCTSGNICGPTHTCIPDGCPPPVASCTTGTQSRSGCTNARTIGRTVAASAAGYVISTDTCSASNKFDTCDWDAGGDHAYRLYMRKGESASLDVVIGGGCVTSFWSMTLKVYSNTGCDSQACTTEDFCDDHESHDTRTYVAPRDGWYTIVVDGSTAFDDEGDYKLTVKLTCAKAGCECP
jgi:hypothetical protein